MPASFGASIRSLLFGGGLLVAAVLGLKILVLLLEPLLTFMPVRDLPITPGDVGLPFEEAFIPTEDGVEIHGWFIPGRREEGAAEPFTLLFFHGNAENIAPYVRLAQLTHGAGQNIFLVDYRGYGKSSGRPSETGIYRDGEAALRYLSARPDVDAARIVVWGRSIGGSVAVHLGASGGPVAGLVLESSFTSARELLRDGGAFLLYPLTFLASYRFDQLTPIRRVAAPILMIHGTEDEVAPFHLGQRLFDAAPGRKEFFAIEGGGHNDLLARHESELWTGVRRFLERLDSTAGD